MHAWVEKKLQALDAQKLRRKLDLPQGIDLTSNDTLSLKNDERLLQAAQKAGHSFGVGSGGSRLLRGNHHVHSQVEKQCAHMMGLESTLLLTSGWHAVMAFTSAFIKKEDVVLSDSLNHACLIDAIRSSGVQKQIYKHLDLEDLKHHAQKIRKWHTGRLWLFTESYFSMDADLAPLNDLLAIAEDFDIHLFVDHAHATGIYPEMIFEHPRIMGHLIGGGKALGAAGAFLGLCNQSREWVINQGRAFVFTTGVSPLIAGALNGALNILQDEPQRKAWVQDNANYLREQLHKETGLKALGTGPIVPILIGDTAETLRLASLCQEQGFDIRAIRPPTVPQKSSRLRVMCHANHRSEDYDRLVQLLKDTHTQTQSFPQSSSAAPRGLIIAGTDTDAGKTLVSALLQNAFNQHNIDCTYIKPVQTGDVCDSQTVGQLSRTDNIHPQSPLFHFEKPASIDQAARAENKTLNLNEVLEKTRNVLKDTKAFPTLELAGGVKVPLNDTEDQIDVLRALQMPVVLCAKSGLGTLNHTFLTVELLKRQGIEVLALFMVGAPHEDNRITLQKRLKHLPIFELDITTNLDASSLVQWLKHHSLQELFDDLRLA